MNIDASLKKAIVPGIYCTFFLSILFVLFSWKDNSPSDIFTALPYFIILYSLFFSVGKPLVSDFLRKKLDHDIRKIIIFPAFLIVFYYSYVIINGKNPLQGQLFLVPYLLFFPVLVFAARGGSNEKINWLDFTVFFLFMFPVTLIKAEPSGDLPFRAGGFDSIYRISVILTAVFAFVTVRNIRDTGFYPVFKWRYFFTAIGVWLVFYLFVFGFGYAVDFIKLSDKNTFTPEWVEKIARNFVAIFLHTAIFEELVFRGLLQNMLAKRIEQAHSFKTFWSVGLVILLLLSLVAGYSLKGSMPWFPALVTLLLFVAAFMIEKMGKTALGAYTALAITSALFGLVHLHAGSIIFVGLASIGGWAYGYTYIKTKNVFYAALVHTLVNSTPLIFGLELMK